MLMYGIRFEEQGPIVVSDPNRSDVACFVGYIRQRTQQVPLEIRRWLCSRQWIAAIDDQPVDLENLPVPIDTWDIFDLLFDWQHRTLDERDTRVTTYLGAAVRSFFAQGGRKCYVVCVGEPWSYESLAHDSGAATAAERVRERRQRMNEKLERLIPGYPIGVTASPVAPPSWRGIGHLFGLPDVSFLALPDLADIVGVEPAPLDRPTPLPLPAETFVECSEPQPAPADGQELLILAPRCDEIGYAGWARALHLTADLLARQQREIQLVAAIPIPVAGTLADQNLLSFLIDDGCGPLSTPLKMQRQHQTLPSGLVSAFVQLVYPWVRTPGSGRLPEQLECPDGVLTGLLARSALSQGAFRSAADQHLADVYDLYPHLGRDQVFTPVRADPTRNEAGHALLERVSLFGPTPDGLRLLSDVTTSLSEQYRPASVNRLMASIVRAARLLGESIMFETSNEELWDQVRSGLRDLLLGLLRAGALRGQTAAEAFDVRCDHSTMSQNDIDNGRVIAQVHFDAAVAIEQIAIVLAMDESGQVSLAAAEAG